MPKFSGFVFVQRLFRIMIMQDDRNTVISGIVEEAMPNTMFRVTLEDGRKVLSSLKGTMRKRYVRIFPGDKVLVEFTKYDHDRGRIVQKINR